MKHFALKISGIVLLLLIICLTLKISFSILISPTYLILVLFGAVLLGVTSVQRPAVFGEYLDAVGKQGLNASYMISFLALFICFSESIDYESVRAQTMECMIPVLYGFILRIILSERKRGIIPEKKEEADVGKKIILKKDAILREEAEVGEDTVIKEEASVREEERQASGTIQEALKEKGLTKRECEVAMLLLENLSNQEIAEELFLTENTVKKHNANIYKKIDVTSREQLKYKLRGYSNSPKIL